MDFTCCVLQIWQHSPSAMCKTIRNIIYHTSCFIGYYTYQFAMLGWKYRRLPKVYVKRSFPHTLSNVHISNSCPCKSSPHCQPINLAWSVPKYINIYIFQCLLLPTTVYIYPCSNHDVYSIWTTITCYN